MLQSIIDYLNNYFVTAIQYGTYTIENGTLTIPNAQSNQYVMIKGSILNDGVYKYPLAGLTDETFSGEIWLLAIPKAILDLETEIIAYNATATPTQFQSESFNGYSYSKKADTSWQTEFKSKLKQYKKI